MARASPLRSISHSHVCASGELAIERFKSNFRIVGYTLKRNAMSRYTRLCENWGVMLREILYDRDPSDLPFLVWIDVTSFVCGGLWGFFVG